MTPEEKDKIVKRIQISTLNIYALMKAAKHEIDFIRQYPKLVENEDLLEAYKKGFPPVSYFIKVVGSDLEKGHRVTKRRLDESEDVTYQILEFLETKMNEIK